MRAFITATDTSAGKTFATNLLTRHLRKSGLDTLALKPVCSGDRDDARVLREAADNEPTLDEVNPFWFSRPLAPALAAELDGRTLCLNDFDSWFRQVSEGRNSILVEGAGGWLVPVGPDLMVSDLCVEWQLPVILVVANRLGCLNHTLLTLESIKAKGASCLGLIINQTQNAPDESQEHNRKLLERWSRVPVLFEIAHGQASLAAQS